MFSLIVPRMLVQDMPTRAMALCRQATSHYLNWYWTRFIPLYGITRPQWVNDIHNRTYFANLLNTMPTDVKALNSLTPAKFEWNCRYAIFKQTSVIDCWGISCEISLIWMSIDFIDDQSTLVQVMTWCRQATSHYVSQCWPRCLSPYGVPRPEWVNVARSSAASLLTELNSFFVLLEPMLTRDC